MNNGFYERPSKGEIKMTKKYLNKCSISLAIRSLKSKFNVHSLLLLHCVKQKNNLAPGPDARLKQEGKAGVPDTADEHSLRFSQMASLISYSHHLESTARLALVFLKAFRDYALPFRL